MVSTLDSESSDPSSNLGGTCASHFSTVLQWGEGSCIEVAVETNIWRLALPSKYDCNQML